MINKNHLTVATLVAGRALLVGCRPANAADGKDQTSSSSEASISTNDNGTVSRTFVESSVTTNGNMVTERRRETRTSTDAEGNLLATSTSEYAQSYSLGETLAEPAPAAPEKQADDKAALAPAADSFLGVKFGEEVPGVTNFVRRRRKLDRAPRRRGRPRRLAVLHRLPRDRREPPARLLPETGPRLVARQWILPQVAEWRTLPRG